MDGSSKSTGKQGIRGNSGKGAWCSRPSLRQLHRNEPRELILRSGDLDEAWKVVMSLGLTAFPYVCAGLHDPQHGPTATTSTAQPVPRSLHDFPTPPLPRPDPAETSILLKPPDRALHRAVRNSNRLRPQRGEHRLLDEIEAGWLNERRQQIDFCSSGNALPNASPKRGRRMPGGERQRRWLGSFWAISRKVVPLPRNHMAHAAAGIGHVANVTRDHMDVNVRNRLPGSRTTIETDIVAIRLRLKPAVEPTLRFIHQTHQRSLLRLSRIEPSLHNTPSHHKHMARRNRKPIEHRKRQIIRA